MHLQPRRAAGLIDNAVAAAKQGNKPFPFVLVTLEGGILGTCGIGQNIMVEDETCDHSDGLHLVESCAIPLKEAEDVAGAIRKVPGAGRKDTTVYVTIRDGVFIVESGDDRIVEVADAGSDADPAWGRYEFASTVEGTPRIHDTFPVFDVGILGVLSKLKPEGESRRVIIEPRWAAETARFTLGSCRGFLEGNRTPPSDLKRLAAADDESDEESAA